MAKDRAHDSRRVAGPLSGKGNPSDIIKGTTALKNFIASGAIMPPHFVEIKSAHIEKQKPVQITGKYGKSISNGY
jgi:hypothetical protein